jgi:hypothetical protein
MARFYGVLGSPLLKTLQHEVPNRSWNALQSLSAASWPASLGSCQVRCQMRARLRSALHRNPQITRCLLGMESLSSRPHLMARFSGRSKLLEGRAQRRLSAQHSSAGQTPSSGTTYPFSGLSSTESDGCDASMDAFTPSGTTSLVRPWPQHRPVKDGTLSSMPIRS